TCPFQIRSHRFAETTEINTPAFPFKPMDQILYSADTCGIQQRNGTETQDNVLTSIQTLQFGVEGVHGAEKQWTHNIYHQNSVCIVLHFVAFSPHLFRRDG